MGHFLLLVAGRLRTMMALAFGVSALVVPAPAAVADPPTTPPRADVYVQVWSRAPDGTEAFERMDIHSVEQGNKDLQGCGVRPTPRGLVLPDRAVCLS